MSEIKVDTLTGKTSAGNITVTSEGGAATMQLQQGLAKVWASVDYSGGTPSAGDSLNVSSFTDNGTGDYDANFASNMSNSNYGAGGISIHNTRVAAYFNPASTDFNVKVYDISISALTTNDAGSKFSIQGDLA